MKNDNRPISENNRGQFPIIIIEFPSRKNPRPGDPKRGFLFHAFHSIKCRISSWRSGRDWPVPPSAPASWDQV